MRVDRLRMLVVVSMVSIAVLGCASAPPTPTVVPLATPLPTLSPTQPEPVVESQAPTPDPSEIAAREAERQAIEAWVRQLDSIEPAIAHTFKDVSTAYAGGNDIQRSIAVDAWVEALEQARTLRSGDHDRCWGRVTEVYGDRFAWMAQVADGLATSLLPGLSPSLNPGVDARFGLRALQASYDPKLAGSLDADAVQRFCETGAEQAQPIPPPVTPTVQGGLRFGAATVHGRWASALVENTTDQALGLGGTGLRFFDKFGRRLTGVYVAILERVIGPHKTGVVEFFGAKAAPKGWATTRIEGPDRSTGSFFAEDPLVASRPTSLMTSLGMLVSTRVENTTHTAWCASVAAVAVRSGKATASGHQDSDCAPTSSYQSQTWWPEVVPLFGDAKAGDEVYVELLFARPR